MSISPHFLDELRNRLTLSEVIGRRVKVTRAGRESKACCPFHSEKTPSFTINDDKQFYHCFGCGAHGDVIGFIMKHDNLSFMDAVEMLAAEVGIQVPQQTPQAAAKAKKEKDLYALLDDATVFFEGCIHEQRNNDALHYLLERGLSKEIMAEFRVGFAPDDAQALRKFLSSKGYTDKDMIKAGVLRPSTRSGDPYAFFRDRVMFPVPDRRGRIVAFGGRVLPDHLRPPQRGGFVPPKYINSSETVLFHKGSMLYGEPTARRAAADGQVLVLVEGYLDVIACAQAGIRGALAPMGTAVTEEQLISMWKMIPDFTKVPLLCFDGDNAGRKAARRACERLLPLLEPGRSADFAFMPDGEDPDSLIKSSGVKGFQQILSRSVSLFDSIWNFHTQGRVFKTPELRAGVIKQLENEVARIANQDVQVHYKSQLRERISETFFKRKDFYSKNRNFGRHGNSQNRGRGAVPMRPPSTKNRATRIFTQALLAAVINHPHIFEGIEDVLCELTLSDAGLERLRQNIMGVLSDDPLIERKVLIEQLKNSGFTQEIGDICNESVYVHASFCSPSAKEEDVQRYWLEYWRDGYSAKLGNEIQSGWKHVSCEEDEEKLRNLLLMKTSDDEI
ncbi:MAG: DNA primase [Zetaproteobacteria bacterium]|nr:MAG: DNA primase [Zetaproteobacteria bacterium]